MIRKASAKLAEQYHYLIDRGMPPHPRIDPPDLLNTLGMWKRGPIEDATDLIAMHALRWWHTWPVGDAMAPKHIQPAHYTMRDLDANKLIIQVMHAATDIEQTLTDNIGI